MLRSFILVVLLARIAAASEGEASYAALLKFVAPFAKKAGESESGTTWRVTLQKRDDVVRAQQLCDATIKALAAPDAVKPKALDLGRKLGDLHDALRAAALPGIDPGGVIKLDITFIDDEGGWDSVAFGRTSYASITGSTSYSVIAPPRWTPRNGEVLEGVERIGWACPEAKISAIPGDEVMLSGLAGYEALVKDSRAFVAKVLERTGRKDVPQTVFVLEPPELGHKSLDLDPRGLPLKLQFLPILEWAGAPLDASTGDRIAEFRDLYREQREHNYPKEYLANCAALVQKLTIEQFAVALAKTKREAEAKLFTPYRTQYATMPLSLYSKPVSTSPLKAKVPGGTRLELLEGLRLGEGDPPVGLDAWARVATPEGTSGWVETTRTFSWRSGGRRERETIETITREEPQDFDDVVRELDRAAAGFTLANGLLQQFQAEGSAARTREAREQVEEALAGFCRKKAIYLLAYGSDSLGKLGEAAAEAHAREGEPKPVTDKLLDATYRARDCTLVE